MAEWNGKLTRGQAIKLLERITNHDDPYWENIVDDFYDESTDTMPTIYHLYHALGITETEYRLISTADNVNWPKSLKVLDTEVKE